MTYFYQQLQYLRSNFFPDETVIARIIQAKEYMETHYPEQISLDDLAASACLSRYHFTRLFKRTYGRTPFQVLSDIRVREAKRLLKKGIPVRNVCWAVGFESVQSFSHLFKRLTGKTPSAFLNKSNIR